MKICLNEYNELIVCEQISKMKHLISSNPCALLSKTDSININKIARDRTNSVLLPWIATNFQWALDDPNNSSPLFDLLGLHVRSLGVHECTVTATTIRQLLEVYPRGLVQEDELGYTPFHYILRGCHNECSAKLFNWMVEQCPTSRLATQDCNGLTLLHRTCKCLTDHLDSHSANMCKCLIEHCPELTQIKWKTFSSGECGDLPSHFLFQHSQNPAVREIIVSLLRLYPDSYDMASRRRMAPKSVPFTQRIKPILDEELELKKNIKHMQEVSREFRFATNNTENQSSLAIAACDIFCNWATVVFIPHLEVNMERVTMQLQHECYTKSNE